MIRELCPIGKALSIPTLARVAAAFYEVICMQQEQKSPERFRRFKQIQERFPVSRTEWYRGVREGRFPKGIRISPNVVVWKESDIDALIASFSAGE